MAFAGLHRHHPVQDPEENAYRGPQAIQNFAHQGFLHAQSEIHPDEFPRTPDANHSGLSKTRREFCKSIRKYMANLQLFLLF